MSPLADIAIRLEAPDRNGGLGGGVAAILTELLDMLERTAHGGAAATIDLRSLPMSPPDRRELQMFLGVGEVQVSLTADGVSTLDETGVSGVWWVQYRDKEGDVIAELLEVAAVPVILAASMEDMRASAQALRLRLAASHAR